jgi:acyl dehydratase
LSDDIGSLVTAEMRACIGSSTAAVDLPEEIGASDVRRFLEVIGETNPLYRDDAYARRLGYKGRVVPPMLVVQLFRRVEDLEGEGGSAASLWPDLQLPPNYTNTRNAGHEFNWLRPVYVGDRLTLQQRLTDIYVRQGRAGVPVIYLVRETEIRNQHGEPVVRQLSTTAKLPEGPASEAAPADAGA